MSDTVIQAAEHDQLAAFRASIEGTPSLKLRARFPEEFKCFRAMRARERRGTATVAPAMQTFVGFLWWMGPRGNPSWTVDRIDNNIRCYQPGNVQWANKREQANNRSNTVYIRCSDGQKRPLTVVAEMIKQKPATLRKRRQRGWSDEEIIAGERGCKVKPNGRSQFKIDAGPRPCGVTWPGNGRRWEEGWSDWNKRCHDNAPRASRAVFGVWILTNAARSLDGQLSDRFPDEFGESADPEGIMSDGLTSDPLYLYFVRLLEHRNLMQTQLTGDADEDHLLRHLLKQFPDVTNPDLACQLPRLLHSRGVRR